MFVSHDPAGLRGAYNGILILRDPSTENLPYPARINLRKPLLNVALTVHVWQHTGVIKLSLCECEARERVVVGQVAILLSFDAMWA